MFNLLAESVVAVVPNDRHEAQMLSLPEIFGLLAGDAVDDFPGLAAHQAQAWYQFLAQLGALALHRAATWTSLPHRSRHLAASCWLI